MTSISGTIKPFFPIVLYISSVSFLALSGFYLFSFILPPPLKIWWVWKFLLKDLCKSTWNVNYSHIKHKPNSVIASGSIKGWAPIFLKHRARGSVELNWWYLIYRKYRVDKESHWSWRRSKCPRSKWTSGNIFSSSKRWSL